MQKPFFRSEHQQPRRPQPGEKFFLSGFGDDGVIEMDFMRNSCRQMATAGERSGNLISSLVSVVGVKGRDVITKAYYRLQVGRAKLCDKRTGEIERQLVIYGLAEEFMTILDLKEQ